MHTAFFCAIKQTTRQVQGAALVVWGSFVAPFATAQQAFAGTNADQHLRQIMRAAGVYGAVKFLRGPVLATLRRPPFPARDLVSDNG